MSSELTSSEFSLQAAASHRDQASDSMGRTPSSELSLQAAAWDSSEASDLPNNPEVGGCSLVAPAKPAFPVTRASAHS